jgi:hypothetical protein
MIDAGNCDWIYIVLSRLSCFIWIAFPAVFSVTLDATPSLLEIRVR